MCCKGACTVRPDLRAVPHTCGGIPRDPVTGRKPAPGTYGSWRKCRTCGVLLVWQGTYCPCCGFRLSLRPRATQHRRAALVTERRRDMAALAQGEA